MALSHALMTALLDEDLSGYELARNFDTSLGFFWHASHQQIYRELKKLTQQGWISAHKVAQEGKPNKILYSLTADGRNALASWIYQENRFQGSKDDLMVKLYNLNQDNAGYLHQELQTRRLLLQQQLHLYEKILSRHYADPDSLPLRHKGIYLVLDWGIGVARETLQWCERALAMIECSADGIDTGSRAFTKTAK